MKIWLQSSLCSWNPSFVLFKVLSRPSRLPIFATEFSDSNQRQWVRMSEFWAFIRSWSSSSKVVSSLKDMSYSTWWWQQKISPQKVVTSLLSNTPLADGKPKVVSDREEDNRTFAHSQFFISKSGYFTLYQILHLLMTAQSGEWPREAWEDGGGVWHTD